jgi:malonyl-CoA decarboxylase
MHKKSRSIMQLLRQLVGKRIAADVANDPLGSLDWESLSVLLHEMASEKGGEAKSRINVGRLLDFYRRCTADDQKRFMSILNESFDVDEKVVRESIDVYLNAPNLRSKSANVGRLLKSLESPRSRILRQFNLLPQGVHELVDMRADLLRLQDNGDLAGMDHDMLRLFTSWFDSGFLELKSIGWNSPASLLEKLIRYEAVHEITSWGDLRNRVDSDRRCYAFFHARMPEEPLIFVEVALVQGIANNVQELLDETSPTLDPNVADTAIFYSISNAQEGLRGVSMGEFLIKRVVEQLLQEFPKLKNFSTLSPVPGFSRWLSKTLDRPETLPNDLREFFLNNKADIPTAIREQLGSTAGDNIALESQLKVWLKSEVAYFLTKEKKNGAPVDPVARFHFSNGASLGQINWMADNSKSGLRQSYGLMVNYYYTLGEIDLNGQVYSEQGELPVSPDVGKLVTKAELRRCGGGAIENKVEKRA